MDGIARDLLAVNEGETWVRLFPTRALHNEWVIAVLSE